MSNTLMRKTPAVLYKTILFVFLMLAINSAYAQTQDPAKLKQFEDAILRGEDFLNAKDYARAKAEYQNALQIDPSAQYPKDKLTQIRKVYIDPADESRYAAAMEKGNSLMQTKKYLEAKDQFSIAVNIKPEEKAARDKMAEAEKLSIAQGKTDGEYKSITEQADKLFTEGKLSPAREAYEQAIGINPGAAYPKQRIAEIDAKIAADKALKDSYESTLAQGDDAYMNRDFTTAKLKYEQALKIKPGENYPKSMLQRVSEGMAEMKDAQQNYQSAIASADKLYQAKDYETALAGYQSALKILPAEKYPTQQIEKINLVLQERQNLEENYQKAILTGDELLKDEKLTEARSQFQKANDLKPGESYPKLKIEEIALQLLALKEAERNQQYKDALAVADDFLSKNSYQPAIEAYTNAQKIKPEEAYPTEKIAEINKLISDKNAAENAYEQSIAEADQLFEAKNYEAAKNSYTTALNLKPGTPYPTSQIEKADALIAKMAKMEEDYKRAIADADNLFNEEKLQNALEKYTEAGTLKPENQYPKDQIAQIQAKLADKQSQEDQYSGFIADGDRFYASSELEAAVTSYQKALTVKPNEKYPGERIDAISKTLDERKKKRDYYTQIIDQADALFDDGDYEQALPAYTEAKSLFPDESHPTERIGRINKIVEERKALEQNYAAYIKTGDEQYKEKNYQPAMSAYMQAGELKPSESYPPQQIALIEKALDAQKAMMDNYQKTIANADELFGKGMLTEAKQEYKNALTVKPGESYPGQQIEKIDTEIARLEQLEKDYKQAIADADKQLKEEKLSEAKERYAQAGALKPENQYPKDQIAIIEAKLSEMQSQEDQYSGFIADGDRLYANSEPEAAITAYQKALKVKPDEKYPGERINAINKTLKEQREIREKFTKLIANADQLFDAKSYEASLSLYTEAQALIIAETHPAERIERINRIMEERKALDQNYAKYINTGDEQYKDKNYSPALTAYQQAIELKPAESYPAEQIARIEKVLETEKTLMDSYQKAIVNADELFGAGKLKEAANKYAEAQKINPNEEYPATQIERIKNMQANQQQLEENYAKNIAAADRLFAARDYAASLTQYTEAASLKPGETYPGEKISEIKTLMGALEQKEEQYVSALSLGDEKFGNSLWDEAEMAYQQAKKLKPGEQYPSQQLEKIAQKREGERTLAQNYSQTLTKADAAYVSKLYTEALSAYQQALTYKPGAEHPTARVLEINNLLYEQEQLANKDYNEAIDNADRLFAEKDYNSAVKFYEDAAELKPVEKYPKDKILAIRGILQDRSRNQMEAYNKIIMNADRLYQDKVLDQAIDAYLEAAMAKPDESYPNDMVRKIRQYLDDHAMVDLVSSPTAIETDSEKKFNFDAIEMRLRKNNYISISARKTSETDPKVYVNYGKGNQKNGGIVLRSITSDENGDFLVRVSVQDRWYREDNNWIVIYAEGGSIEISRMKIAQGD